MQNVSDGTTTVQLEWPLTETLQNQIPSAKDGGCGRGCDPTPGTPSSRTIHWRRFWNFPKHVNTSGARLCDEVSD